MSGEGLWDPSTHSSPEPEGNTERIESSFGIVCSVMASMVLWKWKANFAFCGYKGSHKSAFRDYCSDPEPWDLLESTGCSLPFRAGIWTGVHVNVCLNCISPGTVTAIHPEVLFIFCEPNGHLVLVPKIISDTQLTWITLWSCSVTSVKVQISTCWQLPSALC